MIIEFDNTNFIFQFILKKNLSLREIFTELIDYLVIRNNVHFVIDASNCLRERKLYYIISCPIETLLIYPSVLVYVFFAYRNCYHR